MDYRLGTTRPTVRPSTAAAPLPKGARAAIKGRPGRQNIIYQQDAHVVNSRAFAISVGATEGLPVFTAGKDELGKPRLLAYEEMGFMLQPQPLCERVCNEFCLVITTLTLSVGMEGSWYDNVGEKSLCIASVDAQEPRLKPITEPGHQFVFQQEYGSRRQVAIDCPTAICPAEPKRALKDHGCVVNRYGTGERYPKCCCEGSGKCTLVGLVRSARRGCATTSAADTQIREV